MTAAGSRLRLLADENYPGPSVAFLRAAGYDVLWIAEARPGLPDPEVVAWGRAEARVVLTFDRDLAERLVRYRDPPPPGLVLLRFVPGVEAARVCRDAPLRPPAPSCADRRAPGNPSAELWR